MARLANTDAAIQAYSVNTYANSIYQGVMVLVTMPDKRKQEYQELKGDVDETLEKIKSAISILETQIG